MGRVALPWRTVWALAVVLGIVWLSGTYASDSRLALRLYELRFKFNTGHRLAEQLSFLAADEKRGCIIIGPSTAREAYDPEVLSASIPGIRFFNGGGTGGSYQVQESQAAAIRHFGLHPYCVVVTINPWIMIAEPHGLDWDGLLSLLDRTDVSAFALRPLDSNKTLQREVWLDTLVPHRRHGWQLNRIARKAIFRAQQSILRSRAHPIEAFSTDNDLLQSPTYLVSERFTAEQMASLRKAMGPLYFDANHYGNPELGEPLINALNMLRGLSKHVIVVRPPESHFIDIPNGYVEPYQEELLQRFPPGVVYVDMSKALPDADFADHVHAMPIGREKFSKEIAQRLRKYFSEQSDYEELSSGNY